MIIAIVNFKLQRRMAHDGDGEIRPPTRSHIRVESPVIVDNVLGSIEKA
jgi:hypothetical protein